MTIPSRTFREAVIDLSARIDLAGRRIRAMTRYVEADRHRHRLVQSAQYIKTSSRKARP